MGLTGGLANSFRKVRQRGNQALRFFGRHTALNLALQGGGAHGAFTWGVLDRLLEDTSLDLHCIAGTSAGAVNAVALAAGLAEGGREGGRAKLRQVWEAVQKAGVPDLLRFNPFLYGLSRSNTMAQVASLWSPYDFNPLGIDPLRALLAETIDFERVRTLSPLKLMIAATEVSTGQPRIFRTHEISIDAVLASACLPTLHRTVEIDGVGYWDGGFSKNPDLVSLAMESRIEDTLLVQINPIAKQGVPTGAREIGGSVNRLTFNAPLMRDVELIEAVRETAGPSRFGQRPRGRYAKLATHRFHMIDAGRYTARLSDDSKMKPDQELLSYLFTAGRMKTEKWLGQHRAHIGKRSTVDLAARFLSRHADEGGDDQTPEPAAIAKQG